ncbi:uncharacterized protein LOC108955169 [Eucalyptus grandis]|uniref:uncharacterized protein LOC108955169 n=1 Tax=Eucalyptus grandis TaxID=71139 RepID=UPI00192ECFA9|nr:uncharacterized protein LOC108955169 [Eucalyptus grandis]
MRISLRDFLDIQPTSELSSTVFSTETALSPNHLQRPSRLQPSVHRTPPIFLLAATLCLLPTPVSKPAAEDYRRLTEAALRSRVSTDRPASHEAAASSSSPPSCVFNGQLSAPFPRGLPQLDASELLPSSACLRPSEFIPEAQRPSLLLWATESAEPAAYLHLQLGPNLQLSSPANFSLAGPKSPAVQPLEAQPSSVFPAAAHISACKLGLAARKPSPRFSPLEFSPTSIHLQQSFSPRSKPSPTQQQISVGSRFVGPSLGLAREFVNAVENSDFGCRRTVIRSPLLIKCLLNYASPWEKYSKKSICA